MTPEKECRDKKTLFIYIKISLISAAFILMSLRPCYSNDFSAPLKKIIETWTPLIYQDVANPVPRADYITNINYDGDFTGTNNWENFEKEFPLKAYVYVHAVETKTHVFIGYDVFHPRDWEPECPENSYTCHENDFEGSYEIIKKDGANGKLILFATMAHDFYTYFVNAEDFPKFEKSKDIIINGLIQYVNGHPVILVEARGHGQYGAAMKRSLKALAAALSSNAPRKMWNEKGFPDGDGVIYMYKNGKAEEPDAAKAAQEVGYALINFEDIYAKRNEIGAGKLFAVDGKLAGDTYGANAANMPWNWNKDYFFDPAKGFAEYLKILSPDFSAEYLYNPYKP